MKQTIFNICNTRDDSPAKTVKDRLESGKDSSQAQTRVRHRLESGTDLVADETRYHKDCRLKFKEKRKTLVKDDPF